jgi:hypothetical protein
MPATMAGFGVDGSRRAAPRPPVPSPIAAGWSTAAARVGLLAALRHAARNVAAADGAWWGDRGG